MDRDFIKGITGPSGPTGPPGAYYDKCGNKYDVNDHYLGYSPENDKINTQYLTKEQRLKFIKLALKRNENSNEYLLPITYDFVDYMKAGYSKEDAEIIQEAKRLYADELSRFEENKDKFSHNLKTMNVFFISMIILGFVFSLVSIIISCLVWITGTFLYLFFRKYMNCGEFKYQDYKFIENIK